MTFSAIRLYNQRHHSYVWYLAASPQHDTIDIRCSWSFYPERRIRRMTAGDRIATTSADKAWPKHGNRQITQEGAP